MADITKIWNEVEPVKPDIVENEWWVPSRLTTRAETADGTAIAVSWVLDGGRVRITNVTVTGDRISIGSLRRTPMREVVEAGLRRAIRGLDKADDGSIRPADIRGADRKRADAVVARIVGWRGDAQ